MAPCKIDILAKLCICWRLLILLQCLYGDSESLARHPMQSVSRRAHSINSAEIFGKVACVGNADSVHHFFNAEVCVLEKVSCSTHSNLLEKRARSSAQVREEEAIEMRRAYIHCSGEVAERQRLSVGRLQQ